MEISYGTENRNGVFKVNAELGDLLLVESPQRCLGVEIQKHVYLGVYLPNACTELNPQIAQTTSGKQIRHLKKQETEKLMIMNAYSLYPCERIGGCMLFPFSPFEEAVKIFQRTGHLDLITVGQKDIVARLQGMPDYASHSIWVKQLKKPYLPDDYLEKNQRLRLSRIKDEIRTMVSE